MLTGRELATLSHVLGKFFGDLSVRHYDLVNYVMVVMTDQRVVLYSDENCKIGNINFLYSERKSL